MVTKTEKVLATSLNAGGLKMVLVTLTSPTLTTGAETITLNTLRRIENFHATVEVSTETDDYVKRHSIAAGSGENQLAVSVEKMQVSATNTWGAALTADCAGDVISVIAFGY